MSLGKERGQQGGNLVQKFNKSMLSSLGIS